MNVDLSGPLYDSLKKAEKEFEQAKQEGNVDQAKRKARECARILRALGKHIPNYKDMYLKKAEEWERVSEQVIEKKRLERSNSTSKGVDDAEGLKAQMESLISTSSVTWKDIGGLEQVKQLMMETLVVSGLKKPDSIKPWKGILLFGPPGSGKTLLAAAAAGSLNATFINVEVGKILSKYYGESSKLVSTVYEIANEKAPTIIFIDEFDALSLSRESDISEASRRMLSSLLSALDGLQDKKTKNFVLTLAATNTPWNLDQAILSRFPRRIYVSLPDIEACQEILRIHMKDLDVKGLELSRLAEQCVTRMYSGRDISTLCQKAMWNMIQEENKDLSQLANLPYDELSRKRLQVRPLMMKDFQNVFETIKSPLTKNVLAKYQQWSTDYGE